jgi:putative transposase
MDAGGDLTALLPGRSSGGRTKPRVATAGEVVLSQIVHQLYLTRQKPPAPRVARQVAGRCCAETVPVRPPSPSTARRRLKALSISDTRHRGEEHPEAKPVHCDDLDCEHPLDLVRVDHTPMDLIVVDLIGREPIGRPVSRQRRRMLAIRGFCLIYESNSSMLIGQIRASKADGTARRSICKPLLGPLGLRQCQPELIRGRAVRSGRNIE